MFFTPRRGRYPHPESAPCLSSRLLRGFLAAPCEWQHSTQTPSKAAVTESAVEEALVEAVEVQEVHSHEHHDEAAVQPHTQQRQRAPVG